MAYFDRFDICEAHYLFAADYHGGAASKEYQVFSKLSRIRFRPSPMLSRDTLTENGRDILARLIWQWRKANHKRRLA